MCTFSEKAYVKIPLFPPLNAFQTENEEHVMLSITLMGAKWGGLWLKNLYTHDVIYIREKSNNVNILQFSVALNV